jgi:hypothetical protein
MEFWRRAGLKSINPSRFEPIFWWTVDFLPLLAEAQ